MLALRRHKAILIGGLCIAVLTLLVYTRSLGNDFVGWDDGLLIVENPTIRGLSAETIQRAFTTYDPELFIPLTLLSYQINFMIGGLNPLGYHLINLLLHIGNALLVLLIVQRLTGRQWAAFACAMLFAIHPLNTEAVAWASARKDVLSASFGLGSLLLWLRWRNEGSTGTYIASVMLFVIGLLAKVSILVLPVILVLIDIARNREQAFSLRQLKDKALFLLLAALFAIIALGGKTTDTSGLWEKFLIGCKAAVFLLLKMLFPIGLSVVYPYMKPIDLSSTDLLIPFLAVIGITVLCVALWKRTRFPLIAWLAWLIILAPSFGNIAKGHNAMLDIYVTSDRYAYLASIVPLIFVGLLIDKMGERKPRAAIGLLVILTSALGFLAYRQSMTWRSTETLFQNGVRWYPASYIAHGNLGTVYVQQGRLEEGLREYAKALEIRPDGVTWYNVAVILEGQGKIEPAIAALKKSVEIGPMDAISWQKLGELLIANGQISEGQRALEEAEKRREMREEKVNRGVFNGRK